MTPAALDKQLSFLLDTGADRARRLGQALRRTKATPDLYVPALCRLASQENLVVGFAAAKVLTKFASTTRTATHLFFVVQHLPIRCAPLAPVAMIAMRRLREMLKRDIPFSDSMLAVHWNNLSERLAEAGEKREALQAAQEAVRLARLPRTSDEFGFGIVDALQTLSKRLGEAGHVTEALAAALEASELAQRAEPSPQSDSNISIGRALTLLANRLREAGDVEQALAIARKAWILFEGNDQPDKVPCSNRALAALAIANIHLDRGDFSAALEPAQEAHRTFRLLAGDDAVGWWEYLLAAANAVSIGLAQLGRSSEALSFLRDHIDGYQALADRFPHSHGADFVAYLVSYSATLGEAGEFERAMSIARESTRRAPTLRGLFLGRRLLLEGQAQNNLFARCYEAGDFLAARSAARRAVECFLAYQRRYPSAAIAEDMARAQRHLAEALRMAARSRTASLRAVEFAEAAVASAHRAPDSRSSAHRRLLAQCYSTLSMCHQDVGASDAAVRVEQRSLRIRRRLFATEPTIYRRDLAFSLRLLGSYRLDLAQARQALRALEESDRHYQALPDASSDYLRMLHAAALGLVARAQELLGRFQKAQQSCLNAIWLLTAIFERSPQLTGTQLAPLLQQYDQLCKKWRLAFDENLSAWIQARRARS